MRANTRRLVRNPSSETEEEKRRLSAHAPSDNDQSDKNDENEGKDKEKKVKDEGEADDGTKVEPNSEADDKEKKKDDDEGANGEERALRDDSTGDRAAERDDLISAYRDCERHRIAAILKSPEAKGREEAALAVALETSLPRDQAIAMLKMSPRVPKTGGISDRMNGQGNVPNVGPADPAKERAGREAVALAITNAGRKARGETLLQSLQGN